MEQSSNFHATHRKKQHFEATRYLKKTTRVFRFITLQSVEKYKPSAETSLVISCNCLSIKKSFKKKSTIFYHPELGNSYL
jgi:hypothetical protein